MSKASYDWGAIGIMSGVAAMIGYTVNDKSIGYAVVFGIVAFLVIVLAFLIGSSDHEKRMVRCKSHDHVFGRTCGAMRAPDYCAKCGDHT